MFKIHQDGTWKAELCFNTLEEAKASVEKTRKEYVEKWKVPPQKYVWKKVDKNKWRYYSIETLNNKPFKWCYGTIIEFPYLQVIKNQNRG